MKLFQPVHKKLLLYLMAIWGFLIYSNSLQGTFILDDISDIQNNQHIRLSRLTFEGLKNAAFESPLSSRPVANISFALNYYLHGYYLPGYHMTNMLIHIITGFLLCFFIGNTLEIPLTVAGNPSTRFELRSSVFPISFFTAFIWLVHPIQTQSVSYIVQRMNSMAAMFYILSLLLYVKARLSVSRKHRWFLFAACMLAGLLALGSKEIAVTLPFFIFFYEWYFFQGLSREWFLKILKNYFIYFLAMIVFLVVMTIAYLGLNPVEKILAAYDHRDFTLTQRVLTEFRVVIHYISLLLFPLPSRLSLAYDFPLSYSLIRPVSTLFSLAGIMGGLGIALYLAKKERLISFCILWFLGQLVMESSVIGLEIIFEHRTYLPSMFLILLFVVIVWEIRFIRESLKIIALCSLILVLSLWTYQRNNLWSDDAALWYDCVKKYPENLRAHHNLGMVLNSRGNIKEATKHYLKVLQINPEFPEAHNNLGNVLASQGKFEEAITHFLKAIQIQPGYVEVYNNLGNTLVNMGRFDEAITYFSTAARIDRNNNEAFTNIGLALNRSGKPDKAVEYYAKALSIRPDDVRTYNNMGAALIVQAKLDDAIRCYARAVSIAPRYSSAQGNLERSLAIQKKIDQAVLKMQETLNLISETPDPSADELEILHQRNKELDAEIAAYKHVLTGLPGFREELFDIKNYSKVRQVKKEYEKFLPLAETSAFHE